MKTQKLRSETPAIAEHAVVIPSRKLSITLLEFGEQLLSQLGDDAPLPVVVQQKPLYKRWWFWTAIGVVVAGGASALAVGLTLRQPSCPDGNTCTGNLVYSLQIPF